MDAIPFVPIIIGLFIRIVIPVVLTVVVVYGLRKLDERWKQEAAGELRPAAQPRNIGCWEINKCPADKLASCKAYANPDRPCWQVFRQGDGHLQERCLVCQVFRRSPVPIPVVAGD